MFSTFVFIILGLCILALGFVLYPLIRDVAVSGRQRSRREVNAQIHYDRVQELEQDLENGTLSREQFDQAMYDLERDLVQSGAIDPDESDGSKKSRGKSVAVVTAALVSCIALPAMAVSVYAMIGNPEAATPNAARAQQQAELAQKVAWQGFTANDQDKIDEAERLYEIAMQIGGQDDPDTLTRYVDFLATLQGGDFRGRPDKLIDRILTIDPDHVMGLRLAANSAYRQGDFAAARNYWERALENTENTDKGSKIAQRIKSKLQQVPQQE